MNRRVIYFRKLYSENFPRLIQFYRNGRSFSYHPRNWSIIQNLVELGKRLSKVDHKTCGRKKSEKMHSCMQIYNVLYDDNVFSHLKRKGCSF